MYVQLRNDNKGMSVRFEWDELKTALNRAKHGVRFETATLVFDDPLRLTALKRTVDDKERWVTVGSAGGVVVLLVVHEDAEVAGEEVIRIISARKATPLERRRYEEDHTNDAR